MKLKDIRFNLRFSKGKDRDGEEQFDIIRSLQDLKDNLNIDDLYHYFTSGQLARWLTCIGEQEKGEAIGKIDKTAPVKSQLREVFDALGIDLPRNEFTYLAISFTYVKVLEDRKREMASMLKDVQGVVEKDFASYSQCLNHIIAAKEDFAVVKAGVRAMLKYYPQQFKLDWMRFYDVMMEKCPLAIFVVLMDSDFRKYYLGGREEMTARYYGEAASPGKGEETPDERNVDVSKYSIAEIQAELAKRRAASNGQGMTPGLLSQFMARIGNLLDVSYGGTRKNGGFQMHFDMKLDGRWPVNADDWERRNIIREVDYSKSGGEWEDAVDKGTRIMILHCGKNITIRPSGDKAHQVNGGQIGRFPLFDGLDFRTSVTRPRSQDDLLLYMEVR